MFLLLLLLMLLLILLLMLLLMLLLLLFDGAGWFLVSWWSCFMVVHGGVRQVITHLSVGSKMLPNKDTGQLNPHLTVYSCAEDNRIMAWDAHTLSCIGSMQLDEAHHDSQTQSGTLASVGTLLSPPPRPGEIQPFVTCQGLDGVLYVGHRGGAVEQWDLESKTLLRANAGHTASVRALAILHKVPYAHSLVLSGADDGTIRVWKSSTLLAAEQEGIRLESERKAQEEALAKRRAKEALELERQRIKNFIAQQKAAVRSVLLCPLCAILLARAC